MPHHGKSPMVDSLPGRLRQAWLPICSAAVMRSGVFPLMREGMNLSGRR
jgi:hypothetical protein